MTSDWMQAIDKTLDEGIAALRRDIAKMPKDHNPDVTLYEFGETMRILANEDPDKAGLTLAAAFWRLATAECRRDQESCH